MNYNRGLTLIEVIIYIALLSIIMTSTLGAVYTLVSGLSDTSGKTAREEEGNFVINKLAWALTSMAPATPAFGGYPSTLTIVQYDGTMVSFRLNNGQIEIQEGVQPYTPLTTANVHVENLQFHYVPASTAGLMGIEASTTIDGAVFSIKKYAH
jgi:prepilin-type N-terminal cleavage/methylation domain-containing protein